MELNWIDILILIFAFLVAWRGYKTGLISQVTTIIAIGLGIFMAADQYKVFSNFLKKTLDLELQLANLLAFGIIVILVSIVINYIGQILGRMLAALSLTIVDSIGGLGFGLVKAGLIIYIAILMTSKLATVLDFNWLQAQLNHSFFVPKFLELDPIFKEQIDKFLESDVKINNRYQ